MKTAGSSAVKVSFFRPILMKDRKRPGLQRFAGKLRPCRKCFAAGADSAHSSDLTEHIPAKITELELSDRGSWTLTIESPTIPPTKIELGRDANGAAVEERLRQVVEAYPRIVEIMGGPPASLDARYRRAIAAGKVNREQVAQYLASVQAASAQSSARPSLGDADGAADAAAEAEASSSKDSVDDIEAASAADDAADAASSESHETEGGAAAR